MKSLLLAVLVSSITFFSASASAEGFLSQERLDRLLQECAAGQAGACENADQVENLLRIKQETTEDQTVSQYVKEVQAQVAYSNFVVKHTQLRVELVQLEAAIVRECIAQGKETCPETARITELRRELESLKL